jgi:hypothetical protein
MKREELGEPQSNHNHPFAHRPYEINAQPQKSWRRVKRGVRPLGLSVAVQFRNIRIELG